MKKFGYIFALLLLGACGQYNGSQVGVTQVNPIVSGDSKCTQEYLPTHCGAEGLDASGVNECDAREALSKLLADNGFSAEQIQAASVSCQADGNVLSSN